MLNWINSDIGLAAMLLLGFSLSVLKQWYDATQRGCTIDLKFIGAYFGTHWVETVIALVGSAGMYAIALAAGQLNVMAALTAGYTGNSLADLLSGKLGKRSQLTGGSDAGNP